MLVESCGESRCRETTSMLRLEAPGTWPAGTSSWGADEHGRYCRRWSTQLRWCCLHRGAHRRMEFGGFNRTSWWNHDLKTTKWGNEMAASLRFALPVVTCGRGSHDGSCTTWSYRIFFPSPPSCCRGEPLDPPLHASPVSCVR